MSSRRSRSGRQPHRNHVQPVEQILAERPLGHQPREVAVGGRNHAHVHLDRPRIADALHFPLLQRPQQLHLQRRAHRPHLVEEERALVRLLEPADAVADRAGERAAHVAEQLRLEQRLGNRAAVDRDELAAPPRAVVVNRARHQLLARAGLAADENRAARRRHRLEQLEQIAHRPRSPDDAAEAVAPLELGAEVRVLGLQAPLLERRVEHVEQFVELERLGDEVGRTALDRLHRVLHGAVAGDDDADDVRIAGQGRLEHLPAVDARQPQIRNDNVESELGQPLQRLFAVRRLHDIVALVRQPLGYDVAQRRLVFDDQQMFRGISHLVERQHFDTTSRIGEADCPCPYSPADAGPIHPAKTVCAPSKGCRVRSR